MCSVTPCHGAACHEQQQRGTRLACKSPQCRVCCSLSKVVRGACQVTAAGAAAAPDHAALSLATLTWHAVEALNAAIGKTSCPMGMSHEPFVQGGLFEAAVRGSVFQGLCSSGAMPWSDSKCARVAREAVSLPLGSRAARHWQERPLRRPHLRSNRWATCMRC